MFSNKLILAALAAPLLISACGGGSSDPVGSASSISTKSVYGPLDTVQNQLDNSVFEPLAGATAGTPLEGVVMCANQIVNHSALDMGDALLAEVPGAASGSAQPDPLALANALGSLAVQVSGFLNSLAGQADNCTAGSMSLDQLASGTNPLEGTPLAPLGAAVAPVLSTIAHTVIGAGLDPSSFSLADANSLTTQLQSAFSNGLSQLPIGSTGVPLTTGAPVVGGILLTVADSLVGLKAITGAVQAQDPGATANAIADLLDKTIVDVTTQIVPLAYLEDLAGQPGVITDKIAAIAALAASAIKTGFAQITNQAMATQLTSALSPLTDLMQNSAMPSLAGTITDALASGTASKTGGPLPNTALTGVVNGLIDGLEGLVTGGLPFGTQACPVSGFPVLGALCALISL